MSDSSIDTRSWRKEAFTMLKTGEAIEKTLKWTMRTKLKSASPLKKVSLTISPPVPTDEHLFRPITQPGSTLDSPTRRSPIASPKLEQRATFTQSGVSRVLSTTVPDISPSIVTLKGSVVPVNYVKDAMVDVFKKESVVLRKSSPKGKARKKSFLMSDELSIGSHNDFYDSTSSVGVYRTTDPSFMQTTQTKQVATLVDPKAESSYRWKKMKQQRDERNASIERRKAKEELIYNFKRVVMNTEQGEFHRAYEEQYMHKAYTTQKQHQERVSERRRLDENLNKRLIAKKKQQQEEGKFMRAMLRESASKAKDMWYEEVTLSKMNKELSGLVGRSQSSLDVYSSSQVLIPEHLNNKIKTAKSLVTFEAAKKDVKKYYETAMSERIAEYAKTRSRAISRASETDARITLSPILGADLFKESVTSFKDSDYDLYINTQLEQMGDHTYIDSPAPPRPSTSDVALREYFASRVTQQEAFDLENFSLHSADELSAAAQISYIS